MIPANITKDHILLAIKEISQHGVPDRRKSRNFILRFEGHFFPPKYVISVANRHANGHELLPSQFSGGQESNSFLIDLGFEITKLTPRRPGLEHGLTSHYKPSKIVSQELGHNERCRACKESVKSLLERIYGKVHSNYALGWGTLPEDFVGSPSYATLQEIYQSLQKFRDYNDFVHTQTLSPVDFFIPNPGFIVEFDESQHFTACRKLTLSKYPPNLPLGFDKEKWMRLCDEISARDEEPVYRDEQRAWYDTLRDLIPSIRGLKPTIRLYAAEMEWCSLDRQNAEDVKTFQELLEEHIFIEQVASAPPGTETVSRHPEGQLRRNLSSAVATVLTEVWGKIADGDRDCLIRDVLAHVVTKTQRPVVIVFPAGFYSDSALADLFSRTGKKVAHALKAADPDGRVCICLGLDGLDNQGRAADQLVVAISRRGLEAAGRKFYPTKSERGFVNLGKPAKGEFGLERVLRWPLRNGSTFYLAACYDGYGIGNRATGTQKPTDAVLELIHGFDQPHSGNSGVGYYPRGLARASQNWNCPVFSAASFRDRYLSRNFPSGLWVQGWTKGWNAWSYQDNKMSPPDDRFELSQSGCLGALVQIWNVG